VDWSGDRYSTEQQLVQPDRRNDPLLMVDLVEGAARTDPAHPFFGHVVAWLLHGYCMVTAILW
jgi:hypothetical protein